MEELKRSMERRSGGGEKEATDEFYENLEAPKFVDLTAPDPRHSGDDRYWFCSRVGCDQKHEEELDSESIYKNFVLRVMAARSPNVRLRKALIRKAPSAKCPLSAPAKSSKSRVSSLAMISSISQKVGYGRMKTGLPSKVSSTPIVKAIPVASKFMTTPRNKGCIRNPNSFRSVQNPKATSILVPKTRVVAKALLFHSPKKILRKKPSLESENTPLSKICEGMEMLEIDSQKKRMLGYSSKSSKDVRHKFNRPLGLEASNKSARKVKVCEVNKSHSRKLKAPKDKPLGLTKEENKEDLKKPCGSVQHEQVHNFSTDMDIGDRSGNDALEVGLESGNGPLEVGLESESSGNEANGYEEPLKIAESLENSISADPSQEEVIPTSKFSDSELLNPSTDNTNSLSSPEDRFSDENELKIEVLEGQEEEKLEERQLDEKIRSCSVEKVSEDQAPLYQASEGAGRGSDVLDTDDKENAVAPDINRAMKLNTDTSHTGKMFPRDNNQKVDRTLIRKLNEGLASAATGAQRIKYRKPKPTNPKPFRLRTDERGILKEANLEKRLHPVTPVKETTMVSRLAPSNSQRRQENHIIINEKCPGRSGSENDSNKDNENESCKKIKKGQPKDRRKTPKRQSPKTNQKSKQPLKHNHDSGVQKLVNTSDSKPMSLRQQLVRPNGVTSTTKKMASCMKPDQLRVVKETSSKFSRPIEAEKPTMSCTISATSRSLFKGRRPITIPKEPNFQSIHKPKSCRMNLAS